MNGKKNLVRISQCLPESLSQEVLDFGTMGMGEKPDIFFAILNKNLTVVTLQGWGTNLTGTLSGWHPKPAMLQLSDFCSNSQNKCLASRPFPWYQNPTLPETEIRGKTENKRKKIVKLGAN